MEIVSISTSIQKIKKRVNMILIYKLEVSRNARWKEPKMMLVELVENIH